MLFAFRRRNLRAVTVSGYCMRSIRSSGGSSASCRSEQVKRIIFLVNDGSFCHFESVSCGGKSVLRVFSVRVELDVEVGGKPCGTVEEGDAFRRLTCHVTADADGQG